MHGAPARVQVQRARLLGAEKVLHHRGQHHDDRFTWRRGGGDGQIRCYGRFDEDWYMPAKELGVNGERHIEAADSVKIGSYSTID